MCWHGARENRECRSVRTNEKSGKFFFRKKKEKDLSVNERNRRWSQSVNKKHTQVSEDEHLVYDTSMNGYRFENFGEKQ